MSNNAAGPIPTAEELKDRIQALQIRERDHEIANMKFLDLTKNFAEKYCQDAK